VTNGETSAPRSNGDRHLYALRVVHPSLVALFIELVKRLRERARAVEDSKIDRT